MSKFAKTLAVAAAGAILVGCVSTNNIPMTPDAATTLKNRPVSTAKRAKPDFAAMTPGKAAFAMVGAIAMISAGNEIIAQNNVDDPADYISTKLSTDLSKKYGTKVSMGTVTIDKEDVEAIAKANAGKDLLLDIRTINWSFGYFPTTWSKFRVMYSAKLRLIDMQKGNVVAEGFCARVPDETPTAPTYDELLANKAERLKKELREAADFCVGEFKSKVLML